MLPPLVVEIVTGGGEGGWGRGGAAPADSVAAPPALSAHPLVLISKFFRTPLVSIGIIRY